MIIVVDDAFSHDLCDQIKAFIDDRGAQWEQKTYGIFNSVECRAMNLSDLKDAEATQLDAQIYTTLTHVIRFRLTPAIVNRIPEASALTDSNLGDSGYELRKIHGATRQHYDEHVPLIKGNRVQFRVMSICVCLSDCDDKLIFPAQDVEVQYGKGKLVCFPVSWAFPHKTTYTGVPSYRMQTWLTSQHAM
jgi:hypothetical protein